MRGIVTNMENSIDIKSIVKMFQRKKIKSFYDVPEEIRNDKQIVALQRKHGHRISNLKGYDVINNEFFVEESIAESENSYEEMKTTFSTFEDYYNFLDGDIYENACYYQYVFSNELINTYKIDLEKVNFSIKLDSSVDKIKSDLTDKKQKYREKKKELHIRKIWIEKFNEATTYDDFMSVVRNYGKAHRCFFGINFYIWNYIAKNRESSFDIIVKYLSNKNSFDAKLLYAMCFIFGTERVESSFKYAGMAASTNAKHNAEFKRVASNFKTKEFERVTNAFFDIETGFYCTKTNVYESNYEEPKLVTSLYNYFETFEALGEHLNYDFSNCDFTNAFDLPEEKILKFNENTSFPIKTERQLTKKISKGYDRKNGGFYVQANFYSQQEKHYCSTTRWFKYFFEFVSFLNYNLEGANLIFCEGLKNLSDFSKLNIESARVVSPIKIKAGGLIESPVLRIEAKNYDNIEKNELETALILQNNRNELLETETLINDDKIYYITDLHLEHRLNHACCKTKEDCIYTIQKIIDNLLKEITFDNQQRELLLIGGDTASTFGLFKLFVKLLKTAIEKGLLSLDVIFTLGNHELWEFPNSNVDNIVNEYRSFLKENGMHLLHNEILCAFDKGIQRLSLDVSKEDLKQSRAILFGGIGFSGYNEEFNANNGIYRNAISRKAEIEESNKTKKAYECLCKTFCQEQIIVFTHMPFNDWCGAKERQENYIYISGHNHKNEYYDDGVIRVYSDNQIGYSKVEPRLKYFYFSYEFDLFEDYEDGIYEITREEYCDFYRGKKLGCNCNCANKIHMLKKNGYYCFIHENKSGDLTIMNSGSKRALKIKNINYYYKNMDMVITSLKNPFNIYSKAQEQISAMVKKIGGEGTIHGAIIDIDYFNHIYLNPFDFSATPYFATDIIYKKVYPSLEKLLESNCPEFHKKYEALLNSGEGDLILKTNTELLKAPKLYMNTDIYSASREIKKMQKLNSNILTIWLENDDDNSSSAPTKKHKYLY